MEERFWRLLSAFETLTRNETVALREQNFSYLSQIYRTKTAILPELLDLGGWIGINDSNPRLKARLDNILQIERANAQLAQDYLAANSTARRDAESAVRRLKGFGKIYSNGLPGGNHTSYAA